MSVSTRLDEKLLKELESATYKHTQAHPSVYICTCKWTIKYYSCRYRVAARSRP